jgi:EAL and modified HD-GYP domain-containing signal transduction protein
LFIRDFIVPMNTLSPPLVALELLADRNRNPAALVLHFGAVRPETLVELAGHPDFRHLAGALPCFFDDTASASVPAVLSQALLKSGCRPLPAESLLRSSEPVDAALPPHIDFLGGSWYLAPPAKPTGTQAVSRALALQLVQLVVADADTHEIEAVLRRDPALSYHLLRLVNSLGMGMSKQITSFSQAILILGRAQLRRWLNLMLFSSRPGDERSAMLLARVAVRARSMELLAKAAGLDRSGQDQAFMAGMFSLLGCLFGMPLAEVLKPLKISAALQGAVLEHSGELGRLLQLIETAERCDADALPALLAPVQVPPAEFNLLNVQAHAWMLDVIREGRGSPHG